MVIGTILRVLLSAMSVATFLLGGAMAVIGIWILASKDKIRSMISMIDASKLPQLDKHKDEVQALLEENDVITSVGIVVLVIGLFIALVSFCGGLGAMLELKPLLLVYMIITTILFAALVVSLIYTGTLRARMDDEILKRLKEIQEKYLISVISLVRNKDTARAIVTVAINFMHITLKCCGVDAIGDTRNSTSWLTSERRLLELMKEGVPLGASDQPSGQADDSTANVSSSKNVPSWLKPMVPSSFKLPPDVSVPASLPEGFKLPANFKKDIEDALSKGSNASDALSKLFESTLTVKTPISCCEMSNTKLLLQGDYNPKKFVDNMKDKNCPFSDVNVGVNEKTCYVALSDYISRYQYIIVTVGMILAGAIGVGLLAALWIFIFG